MKTETPEASSRRLAAVRGRDTAPELAVRRALHALGFRIRLHRGDLPGRPDIVLPRYRTVVMVHGCFWHRHEGCALAQTPVRNAPAWEAKFAANAARDETNRAALEALGWRVLVAWECETRDRQRLESKLMAWFGD